MAIDLQKLLNTISSNTSDVQTLWECWQSLADSHRRLEELLAPIVNEYDVSRETLKDVLRVKTPITSTSLGRTKP